MSSSLPLPADPRWRRVLALALFFAVLYTFRSLAAVLVCFVAFERAFGTTSEHLARWTKLSRPAALLALIGSLAVALAGAGYLGVSSVVGWVERARVEGPAWIASLSESGLVTKARAHLGLDAHTVASRASEYAVQALGYVGATAYAALYVFIGFVLAMMFLFERDELARWSRSMTRESLHGTIVRWLGYVADAIAITIRLQVVVALFNAVFTLPLLLLLRLPNVPLLCLLVLVGGMIPVVGGALSGLVLTIVAYDVKGLLGVGIFLAVTFVLGKIESYYLSPRLTAEHVKLPGLVLVVSLLMFETVFGFWGIFLSFPALYVGHRIVNEWAEERAAELESDAPNGDAQNGA
jgi:predicted PurR-regulated permease PerM